MQGESFIVHWYIVGKLSQFCFDKNKNNFCIYIDTKIQLVEKTFMVCRKSAKITEVFSYVAFII